MTIYFYLALSLLLSRPLDSKTKLNCALSASNIKQYFVRINDTCFLPQAKVYPVGGKLSSRIFKKIDSSIVLFRLSSGIDEDPYLYLTTKNPSNNDVIPDLSVDGNFRSILLDEWVTFHPIRMNVTVKDYNDATAVELVFTVRSTDDVQSWFTANNLISSMPWDISFMKASNYTYFSVSGSPYGMRFYISTYNAICSIDKGFFGVSVQPMLCNYGTKWSNGTDFNLPQILFVLNNRGTDDLMQSFTRPLKYLEIAGTYDSDVSIFY